MKHEKILYICGSLNQTTMMHQIAGQLAEYDAYFTPYYTDGPLNTLVKYGLLDFTIMGGRFRRLTEEYLTKNQLKIDYAGQKHDYDLVLTCSDLIIPHNIRNKRIILVQEGMTDPKNIMFYLVKYLRLPLFLASTATTGLSDVYDIFCVASEGYRNHFIKNGIKSEKIRVTGIPNFDNVKRYLKNDFPYKDYVLVATSDSRETFKFDNRRKFYRQVRRISGQRQIIFKLHPNEKYKRAVKEIKDFFPQALIYQNGNTNHMIANCQTLITQYSSVVYIGIALGKEVHSYFDLAELRKMLPIQNNGTSAQRIARECRQLMQYLPPARKQEVNDYERGKNSKVVIA